MNSSKYKHIYPERLSKVNPRMVTAFDQQIAIVLHGISAPGPFEWSDDASPGEPAAMVSTYIDAQVVNPAWHAILAMLPARREYDFETIKSFKPTGALDQRFVIVHKNVPQVFAVLQLTLPGLVKRLLETIENTGNEKAQELYMDWLDITSALRECAVTSNIRDVLVMDQTSAIYFRFPVDQADPHEWIEYWTTSASDLQKVGDGDEIGLSLRELVVCVLFRGLAGKRTGLSETEETGADITEAEDQSESSGEEEELPNSRKRAGPSDAHQPAKRVRNISKLQEHQVSFTGWVTDSVVRLELLPDLAPLSVNLKPLGTESRDIELQADTTDNRLRRVHGFPALQKLCITDSAASQATAITTTTLTVETILGDNLALLSDGTLRFTAKLFPQLGSEKALLNELTAYKACAKLQGTGLPYLYGVFKVINPPSFFTNIVLITEWIVDGISMEEVLIEIQNLDQEIVDSSVDKAARRLERFKNRARKVIRNIHGCGVLHNNLRPGSCLVGNADQQAEYIVIVGFDMASTEGDSSKFEHGKKKDRQDFDSRFEF